MSVTSGTWLADVEGEALVTDRFPLAEVQAALDRSLEPSSVKVAVLPRGSGLRLAFRPPAGGRTRGV